MASIEVAENQEYDYYFEGLEDNYLKSETQSGKEKKEEAKNSVLNFEDKLGGSEAETIINSFFYNNKDGSLKLNTGGYDITDNDFKKILDNQKISSVQELYIDSKALTSLDLSKFTNLKKLTCLSCENLTEINNLPSSIESLNIGQANLSELDLSNLSKLKELKISSIENLSTIKFPENSNLTKVDLKFLGNENNKVDLDFSNLNNLDDLGCTDCYLNNIKLPTSLKKLNLAYSDLGENFKLNLDEFNNLKQVVGILPNKLFYKDLGFKELGLDNVDENNLNLFSYGDDSLVWNISEIKEKGNKLLKNTNDTALAK